MQKSTKIVAGLGVIAALGVSSIPAASFAANIYTGTGKVYLTAKVASSISMKIDGTEIENDTEEDGNNVTFNSNGLLTTGKGYKSDANTTITMKTNYPTGYNLTAKGDNLKSTVGTGANATTNYINVATGGVSITDKAAFNGGTSGWGITVDLTTPSGGSMSGEYFANAASKNYKMKTTAETIDNVSGVTSEVEKVYSVGYGVGIASGQAGGEYTGRAVYVATQAE